MKKKILFGITSLTLGGAERVLVDLANKLADEYDITIFTLYAGGELEAQLDSSICLKSLYQKSYQDMSFVQRKLVSLRLLLSGKRIYKKYIKENNAVEIAFLEGPITRLFRFRNPSTKKVVWIHNDISKVFGNNLVSRVKKYYDEKIYGQYDRLIFVSHDNMESFKKCYPQISKSKMQVIYNYISAKEILKRAEEEIDFVPEETGLNVGVIARLTQQKAIDRLIKVHAKLKENGYKENVYVIGDGPKREELEKLIIEKGVQDSFLLLGKKENPYPYMKQMDVIALVSYYEGYGMVLEEAKILNKIILITDTAAREALEGTANGKIVDNSEEGIYQGLKEMIEQKQNNVLQIVKEEYKNEAIIEQIKELIEE